MVGLFRQNSHGKIILPDPRVLTSSASAYVQYRAVYRQQCNRPEHPNQVPDGFEASRRRPAIEADAQRCVAIPVESSSLASSGDTGEQTKSPQPRTGTIPNADPPPRQIPPHLIKRKGRRVYEDELAVLNKAFAASPFPSTRERLRLAEELYMTPRSVQIWFQNKRRHQKNAQNPHNRDICILQYSGD
ncbi:hypothetical protein PLICRDRAFT_381777 [Plicaturopsis crispa FD-325 SS-3]|nr:hypothetical protein PLICRDRAFT_381777 [Plicaturopsis crispa FD-325 SS-3]